MKIAAPCVYAFFNNHRGHTPCNSLNMATINPPVHIHLPLYRPKYRPIIGKPPLKKSNPKPVTTSSDILHLMDSLNFLIPVEIYTSLIKECTKRREPCKAVELYDHILNSRICFNLSFVNRLLLMFVSCGCMKQACEMFGKMRVRNLNSWAIVVAGCIENGGDREAIDLFIEMIHREEFDFGRDGDGRMNFMVCGIIVCVLKACVNLIDFDLGLQVHGWLLKMGCTGSVSVSSYLIKFYGKFKCLEGEQSIFDHVPLRNTVVWTAKIANHCNRERYWGAVDLFKEMGKEGVRKNRYTFSTVLKACRKMGNGGSCGQQVHANAIKLGLELDDYVQCSLVDLYGKSGLLDDARRMFETNGDKRSNACSNAMLNGYATWILC